MRHGRPYWIVDESVASGDGEPGDVLQGPLDPDTWIDAAASVLDWSSRDR